MVSIELAALLTSSSALDPYGEMAMKGHHLFVVKLDAI